MIATTQCPPADVLRRYAIGDYTDEEGDTIETHLSECITCEDTLAHFDDTSDSLVRHLPLTGQKGSSDESSGWLKRLMSGPKQIEPVTSGIDQDSANENESQGNFGAYDLCGVLGQGGMGVVYEAQHRQLGKPVAIKVVNPKLVAAHDAQRRFDREIQVLGALRHPGIVSATDAGRISGAAYLVMERIDGIDLATLVRRAGPLSISESCEIGRQIALALAAAHKAQAIHRDVKPSNVMIDRDGQVKLLDFGLAHLADSIGSRHDTSLGRLLGTLDYMAPEQAEGKTVTPSVDLYGLGATLFFLLTGRPPKSGDREQTLFAQIRAVTESTAPRLSDIRNDVPEALSDLVATLLENDPEPRLSEATEAATALEQFTNEHSPAALEQLVESAGISTPPMEDRDAVVRSLSELLGSESAEVLRSQADAGRNWFGRIGRMTLGLAAFGAVIALGILLLIRTDEGTIRIESEVAGVTVEFLDEEDRVEKFQLENKAGETHLKAGKYRVRLAGGYDSLTVEPDVIVLTKNQTEVARVSVHKNDESNSDLNADSEEGNVTALYRGETEAVWQRRFQAETDPLAKIEAGQALISLSESLSTEDRVKRIVKIGGALVQSGWGGNPDDFFWVRFNPQFGGGFYFSAKRWSATNNRELSQTWQSFTRLAETTCESLELTAVASTLASAIPNAPTSEAIFATNLLDEIKSEISRDEPSACDPVMQIRLDDDSPLRLYLCIVQADFFPHASPKAQHIFAEYCAGVGEAFLADNLPDKSYWTAREWFHKCLDNDIPIADEFKARVAQSMLFAAPEQTMEDIFQSKWMDDGSLPYPDEWMKSARDARYAIWDVWLPHLNAWLEFHPEQNEQSQLMLSTLNIALRLYKQTDDWPIDSLAGHLTQRAEKYKQVEGGTTLPDLLSYIILAGGELPPQSRKLLDADVSKLPRRVREIAALLGDEKGWDILKLREFEGVLLEHPVATVAVLTRVVSAPEIHGIIVAGIREKLIWLSASRDEDSPPPMEPLLLLAILTELTGESEAQDDRIAELFDEQHPGRVFARHIRDAVEYPYGLREVAHKWLRRMRERAVSETLIGEIDKLLPGEVRDRAEAKFFKNNPDSLRAVLEEYNRETRAARTVKFDPPIPELNIEQLTDAFRSAADKYRQLGNNSIADALQETAESGRLAEGLKMSGVTGTTQRSKKDGELTFRQFAPGLTYQTGLQPREMVVLVDVELRYSRDGWSSPDWGVIHAPLTGEWELKSVTANGKELDHEAFETWKTEYEPWTQIVISNNEVFYLAGETDDAEFDLEQDNSSRALPEFRLLQSEKVKYSGLFTTNSAIDFTKLSLTLDLNGGPSPESYDTEKSDAIRLSYERVDKSTP